MNLLILGGSGFLSGTLARGALQAGHQVWTLTRGQRSLPPGVNPMLADRHDEAAFARRIRDAGVTWDLAVDCIAFQPEDIQQDLRELSGFARHLIFISTDFVYDPQRRRFPQAEGPAAYAASGYGSAKRQCELRLLEAGTEALPWSVLRPGHIYGPGSLLGCLPRHSRDPQLIARLRSGEALKLVGGGYFLIQPVYAADLTDAILSLANLPAAIGGIYNIAGTQAVEARTYYQTIAEALGVALNVQEEPVGSYLDEHPEAAPFLCHRIYDLTRLKAAGGRLPATPLELGLRSQVQDLLQNA
jgi:nucleoside-diphosphate-sugar epimerase